MKRLVEWINCDLLNGGQASSLQIIIRRLEACPPFNKLQFVVYFSRPFSHHLVRKSASLLLKIYILRLFHPPSIDI